MTAIQFPLTVQAKTNKQKPSLSKIHPTFDQLGGKKYFLNVI